MVERSWATRGHDHDARRPIEETVATSTADRKEPAIATDDWDGAAAAGGSMSLALRRVLAWALLALSIVSQVLALGIAVVADLSISDGLFPVLATAVWAGVGAVLSLARPRNAVGWLLLATGVALGLSLAGGAYVDWSHARGQELPAAAVAAWASSLCWIVVIAFLIPRLMLVFPDGRPPSPRWRIVASRGTSFSELGDLALLDPGRSTTGTTSATTTLSASAPSTLGDAESGASIVVVLPLLLLSRSARLRLVVRFRTSHGVERHR